MASTASGIAADEAMRACQCYCQRGENGEGICVCNIPCASKAGKDKTMAWMCECNLGGTTCQCKFQVKCKKNEDEGSSADRKPYISRCKFDGGDCLFQINKCNCCDIVSCECGVRSGESLTGVDHDGQAKVMLLRD